MSAAPPGFPAAPAADGDPAAATASPFGGTLTFLFTDVEGSTRLWERHPAVMARAHVRHIDLIAAAVAAHGGTLVRSRGEGDSTFSVFQSAPAALAAVLSAQRALYAQPWPEETPIRVRAALHTGLGYEHGGDYNSADVSRCARLRDLASGGQTLLTQATRGLVMDDLPLGVSLREAGCYRLKSLERPEHVWGLRAPDLPSDFAPLRAPHDPPPTNLPAALTSFVGREQEVIAIKQLLTGGRTRLLTLTGSGGVGKTRLGLQVAGDLRDAGAYPDGVWLAELAALSEPSLVAQTVSGLLGVREESAVIINEPPTAAARLQALAAALRQKRLLLVLDNAEHLLSACAHLTSVLLSACCDLHVLVTSREPLRVAGEQVWRVPSLALPRYGQLLPSPGEKDADTVAALMAHDAVRLFVERVGLVRPRFVLSPANLRAVARIARRLDGIPLAIELAAARASVLSPEQIAGLLDDRFRLLSGGDRSALPRQQTLRALIDWSYDLLSGEEKTLFARLSVFTGGWTLEAAAAITGGGQEGEEVGVLDPLFALVEKSLVVYENESENADRGAANGSQGRYRLLETMREYAWGKLAAQDSQMVARLHRRHHDYYLHLAERAASLLHGPEQVAWLDALETEHDNLRAALAVGSANEESLRLTNALYRFWYVRGYLDEGRYWFERALSGRDVNADTEENEVLLARALTRLGVLARLQGDYAQARRRCEQGLALRRKHNDPRDITDSLTSLGHIAREQGDHEAARRYHGEALAVCRRAGDGPRLVMALINLGGVVIAQGDYDAAEAILRESLVLSEEQKDSSRTATALHNLAEVRYKQGRLDEAADWFAQSLTLRHALSDKRGVAFCLTSLGIVTAGQEHFERAALLLGSAEAAREAAATPLPPSDRAEHDRTVVVLQSALGREAFALLWEEGKTRTPEHVASAPDSLTHVHSRRL